MAPSAHILQMKQRVEGEVRVLSLAGEMCILSRSRLHAALARLVDVAGHDVLVDVTNVTFVDAGAVGELVAARTSVRARGGRLHVRGSSPMFHRILQILELSDLEQSEPTPSTGGEATTVDAQLVGAALRRLATDLGISRRTARAALERTATRDGRPLCEVAAGVVDGTIPAASLAAPDDRAERPVRGNSATISRRLDREYVVLRVDRLLDHETAVALEAILLPTTSNADVVIDLRDCPSGNADGLRVLLRIKDALEAASSTMTLREPPDALVGSSADGDLLQQFTVRHQQVPRYRRRGGVDPGRR